jgi:hypothetical protein
MNRTLTRVRRVRLDTTSGNSPYSPPHARVTGTTVQSVQSVHAPPNKLDQNPTNTSPANKPDRNPPATRSVSVALLQPW